MKLVVCFFALVAVAFAADHYTTKYDDIDIDSILANDRLITVYVKCLLGTGKCNDQGTVLKDVIPDALVTACKKCNDKQRASVEKVIRFLVKQRKADWDALIKKYDPQGIHRQNYKQYIDKL